MDTMRTPYEYTQQGILEAWTRRHIPGFQRDSEYEAWREQVGAKKASAIMREIVGEERS